MVFRKKKIFKALERAGLSLVAPPDNWESTPMEYDDRDERFGEASEEICRAKMRGASPGPLVLALESILGEVAAGVYNLSADGTKPILVGGPKWKMRRTYEAVHRPGSRNFDPIFVFEMKGKDLQLEVVLVKGGEVLSRLSVDGKCLEVQKVAAAAGPSPKMKPTSGPDLERYLLRKLVLNLTEQKREEEEKLTAQLRRKAVDWILDSI